ncbi:response regulator transcription factor [Vibrio tasmaniensis]|uniref:response regulator transcription factor n=1 Tax=Vibrio tasmaniensis TaxID=212663 RepID=UPI00107F6232|nr:response regulator transcription factor [Vibrio tasmaniensis]
MNLIVVDDHPIITSMIKSSLMYRFSMSFYEAENGLEAIKLIKSKETSFTLVILDLDTPILSGFEVLELHPPTSKLKYIIFSSLVTPEVKKSLYSKYGSLEIHNKSLSGINELIEAISNLMSEFNSEERSSISINTLSSREKTIIEMIGSGISNKRIALELGVEETTDSTYKRRAMAKLGLKSSKDIYFFCKEHFSYPL